MSNNIHELEQHILKCWSVIEDMEVLYTEVCDANLDADKTANILLGMQQLYHIKFDQMWKCFEEVCKEYHAYRKGAENALSSESAA